MSSQFAKLPSSSVAERGKQISSRLHKNSVVSLGPSQAGALLAITSIETSQDSSTPHSSIAEIKMLLVPSIGTKHTLPSTHVDISPLIVTVTEARLLSGSMTPKASRQSSSSILQTKIGCAKS